MTNQLKPITPVEKSQDLTSKSLKISKQVILENYDKERSELSTQKGKALAAFIEHIEDTWGTYPEFVQSFKDCVISRATTQILGNGEQTRLRNLLNSVMLFNLKSNNQLWNLPKVDWNFPNITQLLLECGKVLGNILNSKFDKVDDFNPEYPLYSVSYTYFSNIISALDYSEDYNSRYSVDESLPEYTIEVVMPSNISETIHKLFEYLSFGRDIENKIADINSKEAGIDKHLEKLEAQLLVKELRDQGNSDALTTIESIIRSATGDNQLALGK